MTVKYLHIKPFRKVVLKELYTVEPVRLYINKNFPDIAREEDFQTSYIPSDLLKVVGIRKHGKKVVGISEGGRSAVFPERTYTIGDQEFAVNVKGCGCLYTPDKLLSEGLPNKVRRRIERLNKTVNSNLTLITNQYDAYDRPIGGQRLDWALENLYISDGVFSKELGMYICPVISVAEISGAYILEIDGYIYKYGYGQEIRLVPSNVRLEYDRGIYNLGYRNNLNYLIRKVGIRKEDFLINLLRTSLQACLLEARTMKRDKDRKFSAYTYDVVDLYKDGVIAADGKLYFADLECIKMKEFVQDEIICRIQYGIHGFNLFFYSYFKV